MSTCIWRGRTQLRAIRGRHINECESASCAGCWPCAEHHCRICGREHTTVDGRGSDQTCATCLHDVRTDLGLIVTLSQRLLDEAIVKGINSEAANLAGPSIDTPEGIEAHGYRRMSAAMGRIPGIDADDRHPLWTLGTWETIARDHIGNTAVADERITITGARAYLDRQLHVLAHDPEFGFEDLAAEVRACRGHLEDVLRDGEQVETGAACPTCGKADLVKDYGDRPDDDVMWRCPRRSCGQWWTEKDYREKVEATYIRHADKLTASQMQEAYRIKPSTLRTWAERGLVAKRGKSTSGQQLYDVAQAKAARDGEVA